MISKIIVDVDEKLKDKFLLKLLKEKKTQKEVITEMVEKYISK